MTEAKRCDACKHWATEEKFDWEAASIDFRRCMAVKQRWDIMDNAARRVYEGDDDAYEARQRERMEALKASRAYVQDGSEYHAELVTGPDFFCALFEAA